jgi:putative ABC transport system permease protein
VTFLDAAQLALANLWRTRLRTILTTLGVIIGIGALVSMVSFGVGMQKNVTDQLREHDLFRSLQVTPSELDIDAVMSGDLGSILEPREPGAPVLDDSAVESIRAIPGVDYAYPEIRFPVEVVMGEREAQTSLQALPAAMGTHTPFDDLPHGSFFEDDHALEAVIDQRLLRDLGLRLDAPVESPSRSDREELDGLATVPPDSLIGREIVIVSSVLDETRIASAAITRRVPLRKEEIALTIVGIRELPSGFGVGRFAGGVIVPTGTVESIPRLGFTSVRELLRASGRPIEHPSVHVRATSMRELTGVGTAIEELGFGVVTVVDQLEEFKRGFLIMDALLGTVGTIALFVASLGIINTMVTSILERTREIGVMKAIGGSDRDIKGIFFVEAGTIGITGGALGLVLGWIVTRIANAVANYYMRPEGVPATELFHMPLWLITGALGFSILVSLLAGLYPAVRAARVDPVTALRHD